MRTIKFRAWDKIDREIREVISIDFPNEKFLLCGFDSKSVFYTRKFNDIELMQYTGLKDKNGKEIYEGDIVNCNSKDNDILEDFNKLVAEVIFDIGAFSVNFRDDYKPPLFDFFKENIEVIGNIYENKELLRGDS